MLALLVCPMPSLLFGLLAPLPVSVVTVGLRDVHPGADFEIMEPF